MDINKVILVGRLGGNPVLRNTSTGKKVTNFSIATSKKYKKEDAETGEYSLNEETQWHQIVSWGKQAENCKQYLKKGDKVYIEGQFKSHKFKNNKGQELTSFEVIADQVGFLSGRVKEALDS